MAEPVLEQIIARKKEDEAARADAETVGLARRAAPRQLRIGGEFGFGVIAEVKRASPSAGAIIADYNPVAIARQYEAAGAAAVSVVTEKNYFGGDLQHLIQVREAIKAPILQKDFILSPQQVFEAYRIGADIVLLIAACLDDDMLARLYDLTLNLGLQPLVETHTEAEIERALRLKPSLLGINNRNLDTLEVNLYTSLRLIDAVKRELPACAVIAESGITDVDYIDQLRDKGFAGALIGESILRQDDLAGTLKRFIGTNAIHRDDDQS